MVSIPGWFLLGPGGGGGKFGVNEMSLQDGKAGFTKVMPYPLSWQKVQDLTERSTSNFHLPGIPWSHPISLRLPHVFSHHSCRIQRTSLTCWCQVVFHRTQWFMTKEAKLIHISPDPKGALWNKGSFIKRNSNVKYVAGSSCPVTMKLLSFLAAPFSVIVGITISN